MHIVGRTSKSKSMFKVICVVKENLFRRRFTKGRSGSTWLMCASLNFGFLFFPSVCPWCVLTARQWYYRTLGTCQGASFLKRSSESTSHLDGVSTVWSGSVCKDDWTQERSSGCHLDGVNAVAEVDNILNFQTFTLLSLDMKRGPGLAGIQSRLKTISVLRKTLSYVLNSTNVDILLSQHRRRMESTPRSLLMLLISRAIAIWVSRR